LITSEGTTADFSTTPAIPETDSIVCDFFPEVSDVGDGYCELDDNSNSRLLLSKVLADEKRNRRGDSYYYFPTGVYLWNFGRHHAATSAIAIYNSQRGGYAEISYVKLDGNATRMILEIYGYP
jgi:hypothetical protein